MHSGAFDAGTENQKQTSKTQYETKSVTNFEHKCAPAFCIYVSLACNQQLAHCRVTIRDSPTQSGVMGTRTKYHKQNVKITLHHKNKIGNKFST